MKLNYSTHQFKSLASVTDYTRIEQCFIEEPSPNISFASISAKVTSAFHTLIKAPLSLIPEEKSVISQAQRLHDDPQKARQLLEHILTLDPKKNKPTLDEARNQCRSTIFNHPLSEPFVEVFAGSSQNFTLTNLAGARYMAGKTIGYTDKASSNQDCMAIAKAVDGSVFRAVADGVGGSFGSKVASEIYTTVVVNEMARGVSFEDALQIAAVVLAERRKPLITDLVYQALENAVFNYGAVHPVKIILFINEHHLVKELIDDDIRNKILHILRNHLSECSYEGSLNTRLMMRDFQKLVPSLLLLAEKASGKIFYREPCTTLVVSKTWEENGVKKYRDYSIGDSRTQLFELGGNSKFFPTKGSLCHSVAEEIYRAGAFNLIAQNASNGPLDIEERKQWIKRSSKAASSVTGVLSFVGAQFWPSAVDSATTRGIYDSGEQIFESGRIYARMTHTQIGMMALIHIPIMVC